MKLHSTRTRIARRALGALAACATLALVGALVGCGHAAQGSSSGVAAAVDRLPAPPHGVIARVGPYTIRAQAFENAYAEAVESEPAATRVAAVPPGFAACVERLAGIAKALNLTLPTKAQRVAKCKERYEATRDEVSSRAILGLWVAAEASALGLQVHLGPQDELIGPRLRVESKRLAKLIARNVLARLGTLSVARLRSYYESHKQVFAVPAQRDLRIVRAGSARAAARIKREIAGGRTFARAARGLAHQPWTSVHGFVSRYESGDYHEPALNKAIFAAKPHVLEGPVWVPDISGYYVFEVLRDYPSRQLPFAQVKRKVLAQLPGKLRRERLASFMRKWSAEWRSRTTCSPQYAVELCNGGRSAPARVASLAGSVFG